MIIGFTSAVAQILWLFLDFADENPWQKGQEKSFSSILFPEKTSLV